MTRLLSLSAALCLATTALTAPAAAQTAPGSPAKTPYVKAPFTTSAPVPAQPQRTYPTPRDPLQAQPSANANQINPYFRTDQVPTNSPLYRPYQPGAQSDPFAASQAFQGSGGKSYGQQRAENPPAARPCANFDRISDAYANCKAAQSKEAYNGAKLKAQQQGTR
jgi:hypothetical protein